MSEVWIIDAARTPRGIGKIGKGALAETHPQRLLSTVLKGLQERNGLNTNEVDEVLAGCGSQWGKQGYCIGRMAALDAGWGEAVPGVSLDRFCGSGLTAVSLESMSHASKLKGRKPFVDSDNLELRERHPQSHQGICADLIATLEGITREDTDQLAFQSQQRAATAIENGYFDRSLIPVMNSDGSVALDREEFPRPGTTLEGLAKLESSFAGLADYPLDEDGTTFKKVALQKFPDVEINHIHHAGNSSGVVDGAGAVVLASPEYARAHGLKPRARIITMTTAGDSPELMLNAPVPAAKKALKMAGMDIADIDLFEINEAFAVVPLKFMRDLDIDPARVNVNGGAMALGHPIGATGAMILGTLLDEMERRDLSTGLVTMCTGGGMAPCQIIERL
jgi:acetyl-CoA C-acetyltransferase